MDTRIFLRKLYSSSIIPLFKAVYGKWIELEGKGPLLNYQQSKEELFYNDRANWYLNMDKDSQDKVDAVLENTSAE